MKHDQKMHSLISCHLACTIKDSGSCATDFKGSRTGPNMSEDCVFKLYSSCFICCFSKGNFIAPSFIYSKTLGTSDYLRRWPPWYEACGQSALTAGQTSRYPHCLAAGRRPCQKSWRNSCRSSKFQKNEVSRTPKHTSSPDHPPPESHYRTWAPHRAQVISEHHPDVIHLSPHGEMPVLGTPVGFRWMRFESVHFYSIEVEEYASFLKLPSDL